MATMSPKRERMNLFKFSTALSSAFTEWLLILLLVVDTFCLYLLTKILRCSNLQTPCLVCSRFTYLLGNKKMEFYNDFVCDVHKLEISTFAFCHVHKKLAVAGEMCESCLLSFTKKRLNTSSDEMVKVPLLEIDQKVCSLREKPCSCCSQPGNTKPSAYSLFEDKPIFKELAQRLHSRAHKLDRLCKVREIPSVQLTSYLPGEDYDFDPQFLYRELKFLSDSESEFSCLGDDDDGSSKSPDVKEESVAQNLNSCTCLTGDLKDLSVVSDDIVLEKLIHLNPDVSDVSSISKSQPHDGIGHGLEEISWINVEVKPTPPLSSQITLELVPTEILNVEEVAEVDVSRTTSTPKVEVMRSLNLTDISSKHDKVMSQPDVNSPSEITLSMSTESARIREDIKQRLFQLHASWCLESSRSNFNLSAGKDDEFKLCDDSCCNGLQSVTKKPDADLSFLESADGSLACEVEGEGGSVDCLKKQIEMDRKFMINLYKELEEERNASAIAANQAMAMINKLQEEKASMKLEVMQYLRMKEEQTEYEQEALQKLNEQLTQREKEIKNLEAELEGYRKQCWDESFKGKIIQPTYDSDESEHSTTGTPHMPNDSIKESVLDFEDEREYISECLKRLEKNFRLFSSADASSRHDEYNDEIYADDSKRERHQSQCLHEDKTSINGFYSLNTIEEICPTELFNRIEERSSSVKHLPTTPLENLSPEKWESAVKENEKDNTLNSFINNNNKHPKTSKRNNVIALGDEIEHLHARLKALESDRDFLERAINSLRNGKDGLQFVQEIATHLREIRKIGSTQREQILA